MYDGVGKLTNEWGLGRMYDGVGKLTKNGWMSKASKQAASRSLPPSVFPCLGCATKHMALKYCNPPPLLAFNPFSSVTKHMASISVRGFVFQFDETKQCFDKQYSDFELDGMHVNGELTLGENIADNGGAAQWFLLRLRLCIGVGRSCGGVCCLLSQALTPVHWCWQVLRGRMLPTYRRRNAPRARHYRPVHHTL